MKTPKRDTFFADAARRRIDNEFWVAPDGRVVRLRVSDDPDWDIISSIVSMHGAIAEQQFSNCIGYPEDYVRKLGWISVQLDNEYRAPHCYKESTQSQINTMFDLGYVLNDCTGFSMLGPVWSFYKLPK